MPQDHDAAQGDSEELERAGYNGMESESEIDSVSQTGQSRAWLSIIHQLGQVQQAAGSSYSAVN
jgi:hypothetical protein